MVKITIDNIIPSAVPNEGWVVEYRKKGSTGAYVNAPGSPFLTIPIQFTTTDAAGTLYEGRIKADCGNLESTYVNWVTNCDCTTTYSLNNSNDGCVKVDTVPAKVTNAGFCLAPSNNEAYCNYGTRIYNLGFSLADVMGDYAAASVYYRGYLTTGYWINSVADTVSGPLNDIGVWIDSNCDGNKDGLSNLIKTLAVTTPGSGYTNGTYTNVDLLKTAQGTGVGAKATVVVSGGVLVSATITKQGEGYYYGQYVNVATNQVGGTGTGGVINITDTDFAKTTIAYTYNNTGPAGVIYVGMAADNQFLLKVNGNTIVDTLTTSSNIQFKYFHLFPINVIAGVNYINMVALGDGSVNDAMGMAVYNNTAEDFINNAQLNVLFTTKNLRGKSYDVSYCEDATYSMDSSAGTGNYVCRKTITKICNSSDLP